MSLEHIIQIDKTHEMAQRWKHTFPYVVPICWSLADL